jgi:phosphate starvation-inducible PhoH-like protein
MVITGDVTQFDLPKNLSGLKSVRSILKDVDDIAFVDLSGKDVVRHSLVQRIVAAYEKDVSKEGQAQ